MAVGQHALSGGQTHYNRTVGATLLTFLLMLVQMATYAIARLKQRWHALTYLPSFLVLAFLSDVSEHIVSRFSWGLWPWLSPLVLMAWGIGVWLLRSYQPFEKDVPLARKLWRNLLTMVLMMCGVAAIGNTNAVFHYKAHVEMSLLRGDYDEALATGQRSLETDASLTMLRAYTLSRQGHLGDRLFHYALTGGSSSLVPTTDGAQCLLYPVDSIYRHLGARPRVGMQSKDYLQAIVQRTHQATPAARDYLLCAHLMDRDLDAFVSLLADSIPTDSLVIDSVADHLPLHYREALLLYTHLRAMPRVVYHNSVMDEDFSNFRELERLYPDSLERRGRVRPKYEHTYWFYYGYCR